MVEGHESRPAVTRLDMFSCLPAGAYRGRPVARERGPSANKPGAAIFVDATFHADECKIIRQSSGRSPTGRMSDPRLPEANRPSRTHASTRAGRLAGTRRPRPGSSI